MNQATYIGTASALALALAAGCSGDIADGAGPPAKSATASGRPAVTPSAGDPTRPTPDGTTGSGPAGAAKPPATPASCAPTIAAPPMRRLTRVEYNNTVRDLLGITGRPADGFQTDDAYGGFETNGIAPITRISGERYMETAEKVATQADLAKLLPCPPATGDDACAQKFFERFTRRAFRRPLEPGELDRVLGVFKEKKARADFAAGVRLAITAVVQAPSFLYRPELATSGGALTTRAAFELASRLSYFLWSSMPDDALFAAADSGALGSRDKLEGEARRMLADAKAMDAIQSFHRQWLGTVKLDLASKDDRLFPEFKPALKSSMRAETQRFVEHVFREAGGSWTTLLGAPYSFVDAPLAAHYGVAGAPAAGLARVDLPAGQRSGVLTQAGLLSVEALPDQGSPIHRGLFVRESLYCMEVPPPPQGVDIVPPRVNPNSTTKQRFEQHRKDPACAGCHQLFDPIGFGFSHYDAIGRWMTMDGKLPVDATGELLGTGDSDGVFDGAIELAARVVKSPTAQTCMVKQWLRFAIGRPETAAEACLVDGVAQRFVAAKLDLRELLVAVAGSDLFRQRNTTN